VEDNFRDLDRQLRERIAGWEGSKGELLDDLIMNRRGIAESDQGRSFRAFYGLLLSTERQAELTDLLSRLHALESLADRDARLERVHYDWIDARQVDVEGHRMASRGGRVRVSSGSGTARVSACSAGWVRRCRCLVRRRRLPGRP